MPGRPGGIIPTNERDELKRRLIELGDVSQGTAARILGITGSTVWRLWQEIEGKREPPSPRNDGGTSSYVNIEPTIIPLARANERIGHIYTNDELYPLLLFRGNLYGLGMSEFGHAQALYKLALVMMDAEILTLPKIRSTTIHSPNLLHLAGVHKTPKDGIDLRNIFRRVYNLPSIQALNPRLMDYIREVNHNTSGTPFLYEMEQLPRWSSNSHVRNTRSWRYQRDPHTHIRKPLVRDNGIEIPEQYPFYTEPPGAEHELLEWAHHLVPKGIPDHWRQDICQDLIVAALTGEVRRDNADSSVRKYISKVFKQYPSKYGDLSLDQAFSDSDDRNMLDKLAASLGGGQWE